MPCFIPFQFICDIKALHKVKKQLESENITVSDARMEYIPHMFTTLKPEGLEQAGELIDKFEEIEDVIKVYSNIKGEDAT